MKKIILHAEYAQFSMSGVRKIVFPYDNDGVGLTANSTCINVGCHHSMDGPTTVSFGLFEEVANGSRDTRFDGFIDTPDRRVDVFDANDPEIVSMTVPHMRTRVRMWTNHPTYPDEVVIALS